MNHETTSMQGHSSVPTTPLITQPQSPITKPTSIVALVESTSPSHTIHSQPGKDLKQSEHVLESDITPPRVIFKPTPSSSLLKSTNDGASSDISSSYVSQQTNLPKHRAKNRSVEFALDSPSEVPFESHQRLYENSQTNIKNNPMEHGLLSNASIKSENVSDEKHGQRADDSHPNPHHFNGDLDSLLVLTRSVPPPTFLQTIREVRTQLRIFQSLFSIVAFVALGFSTFATGFPSWVQSESGINIMCFVSISSLIVSSSCIFLYLNPRMLGISPQRHHRFSWVEVAVDFIFTMMWILASTRMVWFNRCPRSLLSASGSTSLFKDCVDWFVSYLFGYACVALFSITFSMGIYDLIFLKGSKSSYHRTGPSSQIMFARGTWKTG